MAPTGVATRRLPHRSPYYVSQRFSPVAAYLVQGLKPCLHKGDVIVLDNLGVHKASRIEQVANERGASVLWLPPYSPDFNPAVLVEAQGVAARRKRAPARNWRKP